MFGLHHEVNLIWNLEIFTFYSAKAIEGRKGNMAYEGDDLTVMGVDSILRRAGEVIFAHSQIWTIWPTSSQRFLALSNKIWYLATNSKIVMYYHVLSYFLIILQDGVIDSI